MLDSVAIAYGETEQGGATRVALTLTTADGAASFGVFEETLYPGLDGRIVLEELYDLVQPYLRKHLAMQFTVSATPAGGEAVSTSATLLYAAVDTSLSAQAFTTSHFLTTLDGAKITAMGREERLSAYGLSQGETVSVKGLLSLPDGMEETAPAPLMALNADGVTGISVFDVSPQAMAATLEVDGEALVGYTIEAGARSQQFIVTREQTPPAPSLYFVNSFGCHEFLHCVGLHKKVSKYDRRAARLAGMKRNYYIEEDRQFTAETGWLNPPMADWADELFRSDEVYVWDRLNNAVFKEVALSDSKSDLSNADDELVSFSFVYGYAQRLHNVMQPGRRGRVFDNTFDHTFN